MATLTVRFAQLRVGAWVSVTVTVKLHEALLPAASVAVQVTVVVPFGKAVPDGGTQTAKQRSPPFGVRRPLKVPWQAQLSVKDGGLNPTMAEHRLRSVATETLSGQTSIVGGVVSPLVQTGVPRRPPAQGGLPL